jgi:esterase/lipase superfamily enzyme
MNLSDMINEARRYNLLKQNELSSIKNNISIQSWYKDHATVRFDIGRQVGKTRYIIDNAGPLDLIVCRNTMMADHVRRHGTVSDVIATPSFGIYWIGKREAYQNVFFDDCAFSNEQLYLLLRAAPSIQQLIYLGNCR